MAATIVVTAYIFGKTSNEKHLVRENTGLNATSTQVGEFLETNWRVYTNTKYRYSVVHPPESAPSTDHEYAGDIHEEAYTRFGGMGESVFFEVFAQDPTNWGDDFAHEKTLIAKDLKFFAEAKRDGETKDKNSYVDKYATPLEKVVIAGQEGYWFTLTENIRPWKDDKGNTRTLKTVHVYSFIENRKGDKYIIRYLPDDARGEKMLRSFEFMNNHKWVFHLIINKIL